jgi:hypothetical protein
LAEEASEDALEALVQLGERLARAREILRPPPVGEGPEHDGEPPLSAVFSAAEEALARLGAFVGVDAPAAEAQAPPKVALRRHVHGCAVLVDREATPVEIAAFIARIRREDQRLLAAAELLGLLVGLAVHWATGSFAPRLVLKSLRESAEAILELGRKMRAAGGDEAQQAT